MEMGNAGSRCRRRSSGSSTPSVTSTIWPRVAPTLGNSARAAVTAGPGRLPGAGMMSGTSAGRRFSMLRVSSVSGVTTCASPAYTTSPVRPSSRSSSIREMPAWARAMRDGGVSRAYIDRDRSRTMTVASRCAATGCGSRSKVGPASAQTAAPNAPNARTWKVARARRLPASAPWSNAASSSGATTRCQPPEPRAAGRASSGRHARGSAANHQGRRKWKSASSSTTAAVIRRPPAGGARCRARRRCTGPAAVRTRRTVASGRAHVSDAGARGPVARVRARR